MWAILLNQTFFVDLEGRKLCEKGQASGENGEWMLNGTLYPNFEDCSAEKDMLIAFDFTVMLAIIAAKFFFVRVLWHWYKECQQESL